MGINGHNDDAAPKPNETAPLAAGVWETESAGSAAVPPRAHSDLRDACDEAPAKDPSSPDKNTPRIEQFRER